jgi:hypothetical protein
MKSVYLILAIAGAIVPYVFFVDYFGAHGLSLVGFLAAVFVNGASSGFAADLFISSFVFWLFMFSRPAAPRPWLFIVLNLLIGLSCALPAYLYADARSRAY